ncbi:uncharacterized protein LOC124775047 [Schistocerca piceifrons]|uniref:uncharacterized protein LOC124775047 n=1 Tax=Schistocerca piceifrons TaxID=274613 RepID=UPI001F5F3D88|nr:uncharacterized protein LOC124775047 [Schistocerca piceifrons]
MWQAPHLPHPHPTAIPPRQTDHLCAKDLQSCMHVMFTTDAVKPALYPMYSCLYKVLKRGPNTFDILQAGKTTTVSLNCLIPAWTLADTSSVYPPSAPAPGPSSQFTVSLDLRDHLPEDISITLQDSLPVVMAKFDNRQFGYSTVSRSLEHYTPLPPTIDTAGLKSTLSLDGYLLVQLQSTL